jgi:hypothetical protein
MGAMSLEDFAFLLERLGPLKTRFHLHGFGEPLLDRNLIAKTSLLHQIYTDSSSLIFSTLGVKVKEDYFVQLWIVIRAFME